RKSPGSASCRAWRLLRNCGACVMKVGNTVGSTAELTSWMFFSRAALVVFKTTGGKAWNPPGGLKPLSATQKGNRRKNVEQTLQNLSVLKMAAAQQPEVPTRLYRHLDPWKLVWMRKRLRIAQDVLGWRDRGSQPPLNHTAAVNSRLQAYTALHDVSAAPASASLVSRICALSAQLKAQTQSRTSQQ
ncbi:hypothetical protein QJQ45_014788, partial [Haematococcus lacustris]